MHKSGRARGLKGSLNWDPCSVLCTLTCRAEFLGGRGTQEILQDIAPIASSTWGESAASSQPLTSACCFQAQVKPHRPQARRVTCPACGDDRREESLAEKACLGEEDPRKPENYPTCPRSSGTNQVFPKCPKGISKRNRARRSCGQGLRGYIGDSRTAVTAAWRSVQQTPPRTGIYPPTFSPHPLLMHPDSPLDLYKYFRFVIPLDNSPSQKRSPLGSFSQTQPHPCIHV